MEKISSYVLSTGDYQCLSKIACTSLMSVRLHDPWDYEVTLTFKENTVNIRVEMKGVARDYSFDLAPVEGRVSDMETYSFMLELKDRVQECGNSLSCVTLNARLDLLEKEPKVKFGVKVSNIQLFEK